MSIPTIGRVINHPIGNLRVQLQKTGIVCCSGNEYESAIDMDVMDQTIPGRDSWNAVIHVDETPAVACAANFVHLFRKSTEADTGTCERVEIL